jgi:esterase
MLEALHYTDHSNETPNGISKALPVVVLLHGLFGNSDNLSVIRKHLQDNYRVINIDLPDHGRSSHSSGFSFEDYAKRVIYTLETLNINRASIVGHSLGGKIAMWIAYLHAELIEHLIILDIAPIAYEPRHESVLKGLQSVDLTSIKTRKDADAAMAKYIQDSGTRAFLLKSLYEEAGQWQWRFNLALLARDYNLLSEWPLVDTPVFSKDTLFIKGDQSDYILPEHQVIIMRQFPKAKAKVVPAAHWLHAEKPQIVNSLITKHLLT